jgi:hypothetical protein
MGQSQRIDAIRKQRERLSAVPARPRALTPTSTGALYAGCECRSCRRFRLVAFVVAGGDPTSLLAAFPCLRKERGERHASSVLLGPASIRRARRRVRVAERFSARKPPSRLHAGARRARAEHRGRWALHPEALGTHMHAARGERTDGRPVLVANASEWTARRHVGDRKATSRRATP